MYTFGTNISKRLLMTVTLLSPLCDAAIASIGCVDEYKPMIDALLPVAYL